MQCPGLAGLWRSCPDPLVGLQPFERGVLFAVAIPVTIVLIILVIAILTIVVVGMTDGMPLGVGRRTVDPRAGRAGRLEQARQHLLHRRRLYDGPGSQTEPGSAARAASPASRPFVWRPATDEDPGAPLVPAGGMLASARSRASQVADDAVAIAAPALLAAARLVGPAMVRATAASAARRWLLPSVATSLHATALASVSLQPSGMPEGVDEGATAGDVAKRASSQANRDHPIRPRLRGRSSKRDGRLPATDRTAGAARRRTSSSAPPARPSTSTHR